MVDRWKRLAPLSGVVFVALVTVAISTGNPPDTDEGGAKAIAYFASHRGLTWAQILMLGYAGLFAVVFYSSVASFLRRHGADLTATLIVVGGALMAVALAIGAGATAAIVEHPKRLSPDAAQALNLLQSDIFFVALFMGLTLVTLAMGVAMLRTKALPKALGIVTVIVGVVAISGI